jgi:hypothetical protein
MKKTVQILLLMASLFVFGTVSAQTYSGWGVTDNGADYDTIANYDDTLYFNFTGLPVGAFGTARLVVYYEGDFGDMGETATAYLPGLTNIGDAGPTTSGTDCAPEDSTSLGFSAAQIDAWGGTAVIKVLASMDVDPGNCSTQRVKVRLEYSYCIFGTPSQLADLTVSSPAVCPTDGAQTLTGTPAGGTFSGTNVSGNSFTPAGLATGTYEITYTATDMIGCVTSETETVRVLRTPGDVNVLLCEGEVPTLTPGGPSYVFATSLTQGGVLDTLPSYTFPAVTTSPTTYYYARYNMEDYFIVDTITNDNSFVTDVDATAGDDRGGMAITDSTVYLLGDEATVRFDLDLLQPAVLLPLRDGIFTDLRERKIYSLYNTDLGTMPDYDNSGDFTCNALIALDADLEPTSTIISLPETLQLGNNNTNSAIFSGYGELLIFNGNDQHIYAIDLDFADVTDLGIFNLDLYGSENWADWGTAGYDGADYTVYYRDNNTSQIVAHNLTTNTVSAISDFSDVSDMASFVAHPVNHRLYFHYEGGGQFGGSSETIGYINLEDSASAILGGSAGCPSEINYTFNSVNLGNDTTVCAESGLFILEAGLGYQSYTWNGDNNNWNILPVEHTGQYILEVTDAINCTLIDTINVNVIETDCATGLEELTAAQATAFPVPNNGAFNLAFSRELTNVHIQLVNAQGVTCHVLEVSGKHYGTEIKAAGLATGVYFVQMTCEEGLLQPITIVIQ